jgi:hypothetical protein
MVPAPVFASPPITLQVTAAASPSASVAANCSTGVPLELVALQPVQLVSIAPVPGLIVKDPLLGFALTVPALHPAMAMIAGAASRSANRRTGFGRNSP